MLLSLSMCDHHLCYLSLSYIIFVLALQEVFERTVTGLANIPKEAMFSAPGTGIRIISITTNSSGA